MGRKPSKLLKFVPKFKHADFKRQPMSLLDSWAHRLHLPGKILHPICNAFDEWVGCYDDSDIDYDDDYVERDCD